MSDNNEQKLVKILKSGAEQFVNAETLALSSLRKAIISGALSPGQEIDEEMVASNLNISRMPVRQAMGILESEGLVKRMYRRGVTVTQLTLEEIEEIYNMRAYLEGLALRKAVPRYSNDYISKLHAMLEEFPDKFDDAYQFVRLNHRFHLALYEPSNWDRLISLIVQLRNNTARYIGLTRNFVQQVPNFSANHTQILEACENKKEQQAEVLMREHILCAMNALLKEFPDSEAKNE
jgi:DNA-binding GntR family transcriptional regulator